MKQRIDIHLLALTAVVMMTAATSCTSDSPEPEGSRAISMKAGSSLPYTRAMAEVGPLEDIYQTFGVWAYKINSAGEEQTVMARDLAHYAVEYTSPGWTYVLGGQYLKYWDESARTYDFYAFSPNDGTSLTAWTADKTLSLSPLKGNQTDGTDTDRLVAHLQRNMLQYIDYDMLSRQDFMPEAIANRYDIVSLRFHHILSSIEFRIYGANKPIEIDYVRVEALDSIYTSGAYLGQVTRDALSTPGCITSYADPTADTWIMASHGAGTVPMGAANAVNIEARRLEVPQYFDGLTLPIRMTVKLKNSEEPLVMDANIDDGWMPDTRYIYYISLNEASVILADVDVRPYEWVPDLDKNETVDNW